MGHALSERQFSRELCVATAARDKAPIRALHRAQQVVARERIACRDEPGAGGA